MEYQDPADRWMDGWGGAEAAAKGNGCGGSEGISMSKEGSKEVSSGAGGSAPGDWGEVGLKWG